MEQFNLEKYLENPNRKVVTRRGNPVRIICWDREHGEDDLPIVCLEKSNGGEFLLTCKSNGRDGIFDTPYDLFFADEEKLTEFEKELEMMMVSFSNGNLGSDVRKEMPKQKLRNYAHRLLDLARKELMPEISDFEIYDKGFKEGKKYVLKDLPKWKDVSGKNGAGTKDYKIVGYYLVKGNYAIYLEDLEKLPKEE
jgi:hypothetical protein